MIEQLAQRGRASGAARLFPVHAVKVHVNERHCGVEEVNPRRSFPSKIWSIYHDRNVSAYTIVAQSSPRKALITCSWQGTLSGSQIPFEKIGLDISSNKSCFEMERVSDNEITHGGSAEVATLDVSRSPQFTAL